MSSKDTPGEKQRLHSGLQDPHDFLSTTSHHLSVCVSDCSLCYFASFPVHLPPCFSSSISLASVQTTYIYLANFLKYSFPQILDDFLSFFQIFIRMSSFLESFPWLPFKICIRNLYPPLHTFCFLLFFYLSHFLFINYFFLMNLCFTHASKFVCLVHFILNQESLIYFSCTKLGIKKVDPIYHLLKQIIKCIYYLRFFIEHILIFLGPNPILSTQSIQKSASHNL